MWMHSLSTRRGKRPRLEDGKYIQNDDRSCMQNVDFCMHDRVREAGLPERRLLSRPKGRVLSRPCDYSAIFLRRSLPVAVDLRYPAKSKSSSLSQDGSLSFFSVAGTSRHARPHSLVVSDSERFNDK
jgi:hypothetical protein